MDVYGGREMIGRGKETDRQADRQRLREMKRVRVFDREAHQRRAPVRAVGTVHEDDAARLGETGPLSQGVQAGRKAPQKTPYKRRAGA